MQPEMEKIQRKYGHRQDPQARQAMPAEMMKLYKKYKVNPVGCVGTMFLQFPIFMSMYEVVQRINATTTVTTTGGVTLTYAGKFALMNTKLFGLFEMNTSFFSATQWYDKVFAVVIAVAFAGLQFLQQKLSQRPPKYQIQHNKPKTAQQEQQAKQMKMMMIIMNVMFVYMSLTSTSLAIYWLIGAVYQIGQSQVGRKINEIKYYKMKEKGTLI